MLSMGWLDSFLYRSHARMERRPAGCSFVRACIWATTPLRFDGTHTPVAERHPVMLSAPRTGSVLMLCCAAGAAARYERPVKFRASRAPTPAPHVGQSERRSRSLLISISASLAANLSESEDPPPSRGLKLHGARRRRLMSHFASI